MTLKLKFPSNSGRSGVYFIQSGSCAMLVWNKTNPTLALLFQRSSVISSECFYLFVLHGCCGNNVAVGDTWLKKHDSESDYSPSCTQWVILSISHISHLDLSLPNLGWVDLEAQIIFWYSSTFM
ncbi:hypothetical protein BsWGS_16079 [Bradybaena similaris]